MNPDQTGAQPEKSIKQPTGQTVEQKAVDKSAQPAALPALIRISGVLDNWFETGTEGVVWIVSEGHEKGWDGIHFPKKGDHLKVTAPDGKVIFEGLVDPDYEKGKIPRYPGAKHGQPVALGAWIHWTQRGWEPDDWARLFVAGDHRAELTKAAEPTSTKPVN